MRLLFVLLATLTCTLHGQEPYPRDIFAPPLEIPLILAGTFGELRSNHFHSGLDIKTQQRQGLAVNSIADGSVSRIKISHWGYGKVLYIAHPNGYTSVYAHLQKFAPEIEAYVKEIQYEKQSYEIEVFPELGELMVRKGELIAYSGNSGSSSGPHLHFEIRNSISEHPTNPLLYGMEVRDATTPTLTDLYAYPLDEDAQVNRSASKIQINFKRQADGSYLADPVQAAGTIGFGIIAYDRQDMAANKNGLFSLQQRVNGRVYTDMEFKSFSFPESRYINTLIDYEHLGRYRQRIMRCFKVPGNRLSLYKELHNDGKIVVREGFDYQVELELADYDGNILLLRIPVQGRRESLAIPREESEKGTFLVARKPNNFDLGAAKVYFPANTFYDDFRIVLEKGKDTVKIHENTVPAHRNFTISFDLSRYPLEERKQLFIARLDREGEANYVSTYKRGDTFTTRTRNLGTYTLARDSIAPRIWAKNFADGQWLTNYRYLSLHISDDLSGIDSYSARLNGEWILMEYDPKTSTITYNFDDKILDKTQCRLEVEVIDNVGNTSTFTSNFFRK